MAENTTVNKVVINNETVIDITDTTATPESVAQGQVFYKASGERAVGSRTFVTGVKGDSETDYRTGNVNLTKDNIGLSNVENKSSATIRSELTQSDVTTALGFTPYTQAEVDALVSAVFHYKGTKATYAEIEALTGMKVGDVWQVTADNSEYVYNGSAWEKLGPTIDLSGYLTSVSVAGQTLTPSSNTITAAQLKTALGLGGAAYAETENALTDGNNLPTGAAVTALKNSLTVDGVSFFGNTTIIHYGECTTAAGTAAKTVSCANFKKVAGSVIYVRFSNANTAASPTLNVNNTGASNIRYRNANISSTYIVANEVYCFMYDGAYYQMVGDVSTSATTAQIQSAVDTWLNQHTSSSTIVYSSSVTHTVVKSATDISW